MQGMRAASGHFFHFEFQCVQKSPHRPTLRDAAQRVHHESPRRPPFVLGKCRPRRLRPGVPGRPTPATSQQPVVQLTDLHFDGVRVFRKYRRRFPPAGPAASRCPPPRRIHRPRWPSWSAAGGRS